MNVPCAKCNKTVYPIEKFNCLDKIWHKGCFRCTECNMALNMKTYKGFNKQPYCNAHCPQAKFTPVSETPESKRLAENTKNQSAVKYHEEFEKSRGKFTQVADDPETLRHKAQTKIISNVAYHGDMQKKAAMEQMRPSNLEPQNGVGGAGHKISPTGTHTTPLKSEQIVVHTKGKLGTDVLSSNTFDNKNSPYTASKQSTVIYTSEHGAVNNPPERKIGSIADYDPVNDKYGSIATPQTATLYSDTMPPPPVQMPQQPPVMASKGKIYRAIYDYAAADDDEVSFIDGDLIISCEKIDEGWMSGIVERTGERGMLPANYVECVN